MNSNIQPEVKSQNVSPQQSTPVQTQTPSPTPQPQVKTTLAQPKGAVDGEGFNLIPAMTEEEKVTIKKKNTLNISSILSIITLASIAIGVVGFNIISKAQLNSRKSSLARIENTVNSKMDKIIANNAILDRATLYLKVKKDGFSHKKMIEFLTQIATEVGGISFSSIDISESLDFEVSGKGPSLEIIARLWYLLGVHENIDSINLNSVSKGEENVTFSFEGKFNTIPN